MRTNALHTKLVMIINSSVLIEQINLVVESSRYRCRQTFWSFPEYLCRIAQDWSGYRTIPEVLPW